MFLFVGCSDCGDDCDFDDGLRLRFSYTFNSEGIERLSEHVGDIQIYVFDAASGILTDVLHAGYSDVCEGHVHAMLSEGRYTFVAWGTSDECRLHESGFTDLHMTDAATHSYVPIEIGRTTFDDFRIMVTNSDDFRDLFFATACDVYVAGEGDMTVDFAFTRYSNKLNVRVTGLQHLDKPGSSSGISALYNASGAQSTSDATFSQSAQSTSAVSGTTSVRHATSAVSGTEGAQYVSSAPGSESSPFDIYVTGKKGTYTHDGQIDRHSPELRYNTRVYTRTRAEESSLDAEVGLLRLDVVRHVVDPVMLHIQSSQTGHYTMPPLNLLELILNTKDDSGNYVYNTQEAIDREESFTVLVAIMNDLSVDVRIDGFRTEVVIPDLGSRWD